MIKKFLKKNVPFLIIVLAMTVIRFFGAYLDRNEAVLFCDFEALFVGENGELYARTAQGRLAHIHVGSQLLENTPAINTEYQTLAVYDNKILVLQKATGECTQAYSLGGKPLAELPELPETFLWNSTECGKYRIERSRFFCRITAQEPSGESVLARRGTAALFKAHIILRGVLSLVVFSAFCIMQLEKRSR